MSKDEIRVIAEIVGGDNRYRHFVHRINKEFETSDETRNSNVYVLFEDLDGEHIGFSVLGSSPAKMKVWNKTFHEEGWVKEGFRIDPSSFELMYMYVKPEHREKDYGEKLLDKSFSFTKGKGVAAMFAYVSDRDDQALSFYKKMKAEVIQEFADEDSSAAFLMWQLDSRHPHIKKIMDKNSN